MLRNKKNVRFIVAKTIAVILVSVFATGCDRAANVETYSAVASQYEERPGLSLTTNERSPLGTNTNEVRDWNRDLPFIDIFRSARHFSETTWVTKNNVRYDEQGWPIDLKGGKALAVMLSGFDPGHVPQGQYTVLYEGQGAMKYSGNATLVKRSQGRDVVNINLAAKDQLFNLIITETNPDDHIRNIRIIMPGGICADDISTRVETKSDCHNSEYLSFEKHYDSLVFNPEYLNYMKDFKVIRFMDMMVTNNSSVKNWSDWAKPEDAVWSSSMGRTGVPVEVMVELANVLNIDPWFTMPHQASDDFIRQFASTVKKYINPDLNVYIEYSNEVWNGVFKQAAYVKDKGASLKFERDENKAKLKWYSERSVHIFNLWEQTWGGVEHLVRVLGSQSANPDVSSTILDHENAYKYTDALAIAPYMTIYDFDKQKGVKNINNVFSLLESDYKENLSALVKQKALADKFKVDLIAYEGGQHLVDWRTKTSEEHPNPLLMAANKDPKMGELYTKFLNDWKRVGGHLFVHYNSPGKWGKYGSWGVKEYLAQPDEETPKYMAIKQFINDNPRWW